MNIDQRAAAVINRIRREAEVDTNRLAREVRKIIAASGREMVKEAIESGYSRGAAGRMVRELQEKIANGAVMRFRATRENTFREIMLALPKPYRAVVFGLDPDIEVTRAATAKAADALFVPPTFSQARAEILAPWGRPGQQPWSIEDRLSSYVHPLTRSLDPVVNRLAGGLSRGQGPETVARMLMRSKEVKGLFTKTQGQALRLARTEMLRAHNMANEQSMRALGPVYAGKRFDATMERNTCPVCARLDGSEYYLEPSDGQLSYSDAPSLPVHPNCRCTYAPVLAPEARLLDLGRVRATQFGPQATGSFRDWFDGLDKTSKADVGGAAFAKAMQRGIEQPSFADVYGP